MLTHIRILLFAASVVAFGGNKAIAQRYQQQNRQAGERPPRNVSPRDRDTERGRIIRILAYGEGDKSRRGRDKSGDTSPHKTGSIVIKTERGRQFTGVLTSETRFSASSSDMTPSKTRLLLDRGVPIELNWRTSDEMSGRVVTDVRIRTVEIEGVIQRANRKRIVVMATAKEPPEELPEIKVKGRRTPEPKKPPKKPARKKLQLALSEVSTLTLDGDETVVKQIKPFMEFDAVVIDGGPATILSLHARTEKKAEAEVEGRRKS